MKKSIVLAGLFAAVTLVGCQGRAINGGYDTYRVTQPTEVVTFADGSAKTFATPTTYLNHGFRDKCEGAVRLITIDGVDAQLHTSQFANLTPAAQADCSK